MKKYLKILILGFVGVLFSQESFAQWFVTGGISSYKGKTNYSDTATLVSRQNLFDIDVGYYFTDRFALGAGASYGRSKSSDSRNYKNYNRDVLGFYIFGRKDFINSEHVRLGLRADIGASDTQEYHSIYRYYSEISPVFNYKFNDHWSISTKFVFLSYEFLGEIQDGRLEKSHNFDIRFVPDRLSWGIVYTF